jgi:hypothetical protein
MKNRSDNYHLFLALLVTVLINSCHSSPNSNQSDKPKLQENKGIGKIVFDQEIHNFGTLKDGEVAAFAFVFKNSGGLPFKVVKADKSCGCIDVRYSSIDVAPGEHSSIEIRLNTAGEWGNLIREAIIETSTGEKKTLQVIAYIENKQFNNLLKPLK